MAIQLDGFDVGEAIGSGGFGEVWAARQVGVDRPVAIKVGHMALSDAKDRLRFERECRALGRLSTHPNIVTVHMSGTLDDGRPYLVLEYVDGGTLADWSAHGSVTESQLVGIGIDLASAITAAHAEGILHRDLKPENVFLRTSGEAVLGDFGIAQMQDGLRTVTGSVTASVAYAPPEVLGGQRASEAADVYGVGICLAAAAIGSTPFTEPTDESLHPVLARVLTDPPPDLVAVGMSPDFNRQVQRMLAKDPVERPKNASAVRSELLALSGGAALDKPSPSSTLTRIPVAHRETEMVPDQTTPPPIPGPAAIPAATPPPIETERVGVTQPSPTTAKATPMVLAGVVIVMFLAVLGIAGFLLLRNGDEPTDSVTTRGVGDGLDAAASGSSDITTTRANEGIAEVSTTSTSQKPDTTVPAKSFDLSAPIEVSDTIDVALDSRSYPIDLEAGQSVSIEVKSLNESCARAETWDLKIDFLGPDGQPAGDDVWPGNQGCDAFGGPDWTAESSGQHVIRMRSDSGGAVGPPTGSYEAVIAVLANRLEQIDLSEPQTVSGEIDIALDTVRYAFDLVTDQRLSINVTALDSGCEKWNLRLVVTDPGGRKFDDEGWPGNQGCGAYGPWVAESDGTYTVTFESDGNTAIGAVRGSYEAILATTNDETFPIQLDSQAEVGGTIDLALERDSYEIELAAGDSISVEVTGINNDCARADFWNLNLSVTDPSGQLVDREVWPGNNGCKAYGPWTAAEAGTYSINFFSDDSKVGRLGPTGSYTAVIGRLGQ